MAPSGDEGLSTVYRGSWGTGSHPGASRLGGRCRYFNDFGGQEPLAVDLQEVQ